MKPNVLKTNLNRLQEPGAMKLGSLFPLLLMCLLSLLTISSFGCGGASGTQASQSTTDPPTTSYTITDLGTLPDGGFSLASYINNNGVITGTSADSEGNQHAVVWMGGQIMDLATPGLGGYNSGGGVVIASGQTFGWAESSDRDPNNENFCAYFTGFNCLPFVWENGTMSSLPLLGGNNGYAGPGNSQSQVAGFAENNTTDPQCTQTAAMMLNGTGPQVLDFEAVTWDTVSHQVHPLNPLAGDTVAMAFWINNQGQVVGTSGSCADTYPPPFAAGPHAVMWNKDGSVVDLGNLGGTTSEDQLGVGNVAFAIDDSGDVTGISSLSGSEAEHAFFWTQKGGMKDLGTLPGDVMSAGLGINAKGVVVGSSLDGPLPDANSSAVMWQNGVITDLNTVVSGNTSLFLLTAFGINNAGQIVGFGFDQATQEVHAFLANPSHGGGSAASKAAKRPAMAENVRRFVHRNGRR
jgi:probable HAF family extracellular repeat protein